MLDFGHYISQIQVSVDKLKQVNRTRTFHNHRLQIEYPLSPLSTKMVITVEVVHTEETPYMKKLAST